MELTLCSNCRLPVPNHARKCPFCTARTRAASVVRSATLATAAAAALVTTMVVVSRRRA